jgi:uncharacterized protein
MQITYTSCSGRKCSGQHLHARSPRTQSQTGATELGSTEPLTAVLLSDDIGQFVIDQRQLSKDPDEFSTLILIFVTLDIPSDEVEFETRLWQFLQSVHDEDSIIYRWDPLTSNDPNSPDFSFSVAEQSFFVVGQHAYSSRFSRRFPYPALAFNAHHQFERLRATGKFQKIQNVIRNQDIAIQGSINPSLTNYGADSEAKQYSGRLVPQGWVCPFKA